MEAESNIEVFNQPERRNEASSQLRPGSQPGVAQSQQKRDLNHEIFG